MILKGDRGLYCSKADCQVLMLPGTTMDRLDYGEYAHVNCPTHVPFKRSTKLYDSKIVSSGVDFE